MAIALLADAVVYKHQGVTPLFTLATNLRVYVDSDVMTPTECESIKITIKERRTVGVSFLFQV